jgi:hypothetical protein
VPKPAEITELNILKWAAGAPIDLPPMRGVKDDRVLGMLGVDEERLHRLLVKHRLAPRFVHRCVRERPGWCSRNLLGALMAEDMRARRQRAIQLDAMREITQAIPEPECRPIAMKGYAAYALTGDNRHVHYSEDIDLYVEDLESFNETLIGLGYRPEGMPSAHEFSKMRRGDVMIEPHRYFRVWQYPPGVVEADLVPMRYPGIWNQSFAPHTETRITYDDMRANSLCGTAPGTEDLLVPTPAMSIVALCAHEFWAHVRFEYRGVPVYLATIAYIHDLALHPLFDETAFGEIVKRLQAQDAVAFAGHMLQAVYGYNPLRRFRRRKRRAERDGYPVILHPQGIWASLNTADELIVPRNMGDTLLNKVGTTRITASSNGNPKAYRFTLDERGRGNDRLIVQTAGKAPLCVEIGAQWGETNLTFNVDIMRHMVTDLERLKVHICVYDVGFMRYFATVCDRGARLIEYAQARATHSILPDGYRVTIDFPWWLLRWDIYRKSLLPTTVAVSSWEETSDTSMLYSDPIMLIPLSIHRE